MKKVFLYAAPVLLAAYLVLPPDSEEQTVMFAQEEGVVTGNTDEEVSDQELETYISVYSAMQLDHGLKLEEVLEARQMTVEEFRNIERRVQNKSRLVTKVRDALREQAMQRSAFSEPLSGSATP